MSNFIRFNREVFYLVPKSIYAFLRLWLRLRFLISTNSSEKEQVKTGFSVMKSRRTPGPVPGVLAVISDRSNTRPLSSFDEHVSVLSSAKHLNACVIVDFLRSLTRLHKSDDTSLQKIQRQKDRDKVLDMFLDFFMFNNLLLF